jgi:hypothetical protein
MREDMHPLRKAGGSGWTTQPCKPSAAIQAGVPRRITRQFLQTAPDTSGAGWSVFHSIIVKNSSSSWLVGRY